MIQKIHFSFKHNGFLFFFTKDNFNEHSKRHPELREPSFLKRIEKSIACPDKIYPDFNTKGRRHCCYVKEFEIAGKCRYTKVVIHKQTKDKYEIISAFRPDKIQEMRYNAEPLNIEEMEWI